MTDDTEFFEWLKAVRDKDKETLWGMYEPTGTFFGPYDEDIEQELLDAGFDVVRMYT